MELSQIAGADARKFAELLKKLDEERQKGLYLLLQGLQVLTGEKRDVFE